MNVAIIPAAGSGVRFGSQVAKQFIEIAGAPLIVHTLKRFVECPEIDAIAIALAPDRIQAFRRQLEVHGIDKPVTLVAGGRERSDSIRNALAAIAGLNPEIVAVHDAVRPFVTAGQISSVLERARETGAAIMALPISDTVKEVRNGFIQRTLDRKIIYRAQTPQAFRYEILLRANDAIIADGLASASTTDDALLVERLGVKVAIVEGSSRNLKITTPEDMIFAERLFQADAGAAKSSAMRVGIGYDIHRLVEGRKLLLGGVELESTHGLLGHSDGDSLCHAICDALLGAAGLGDMGTHFPDRDPQFAGIAGLELLRKSRMLLAGSRFLISSIDATVITERPRLNPHIPEMRVRIAEAVGIDASQVSIKAKTNEGLDAIGRNEAIAAQAVALITQL
jgi:2-C-methyl-D-erythritol 4-phosphate cytidylyltransferase / 2-C-methyl-D-erythritol 2,4-cyclodiphosphate synthase